MSLFTRSRDRGGLNSPPESEARSSTTSDILQILRQSMLGTGSSASLEGSASSEVAMSHPIVYRSVSKISGIVAQFPWDAYDGRTEVDPQPSLLAAPSPQVLRCSSWKRAASTSMLLGGGAYAYVTERRVGNRLIVERLDLIHPDRVDWTAQNGWTVDARQVEEWPAGRFWQVPYLTIPGSPKGVNPLEYARRTTFAGLAAAEFGSNFFRDGGHPTAIIAPESDPGDAGAAALKARVLESVNGTNREPIVLPQSVKWTPLQINPSDSQFIESMKFSAIELAGFFGLMPEHVGLPVEGSGIQYSNRENRQQDLLQDAVMPVVMPLEEALSELLPAGQVVKFNTAGLLRSDLKGRYESYKIAAEIADKMGEPLLTVDEMRDFEDLDVQPDTHDSEDLDVRPDTGQDTAGSDRATARELAEILQKLYMAVGVVLTADEARKIVNDAGGSLPPGFSTDQSNSADIIAELRAAHPAPPPIEVHNHVTERQVVVENRVEPTPVTIDNHTDVHVPEQRMDVAAPVVNVTNVVEPTPVTIDNNVTALAAAPTVNVQMPEHKSRHRVKRDGDGRISEVVED